MKAVFKLIWAIILCIAPIFASAQLYEEQHAQLTKSHNLAGESAEGFRTSKPNDKVAQKKHAEAAGKHLANARVTMQEINNNKPENQKPTSNFHSIAIDKYHAEAKNHHEALMAELNREKYDERIAKAHAQNFQNVMGYAEAEHKKLRSEINR